MYAVIETGGKQYRVAEGDVVRVEKLEAEIGDTVSFDQVLAVKKEKSMKIGKPHVKGATVDGEVLAQDRAKKVIVYKYKPKKGYTRKNGHRQPYTEVKITKING